MSEGLEITDWDAALSTPKPPSPKKIPIVPLGVVTDNCASSLVALDSTASISTAYFHVKPLSNSPEAPRVNSFSIPKPFSRLFFAAVPSEDEIAYDAFALPVTLN